MAFVRSIITTTNNKGPPQKTRSEHGFLGKR